MRALAAEAFRYPDGGADRLREAIGKRWGLDPARIVCGAGSDDLMYQLCLAYGGPGRDIIMSAHGFTIYYIAGTYAGSRVIKVPERNLTPIWMRCWRRSRRRPAGVHGQSEQSDRGHDAG